MGLNNPFSNRLVRTIFYDHLQPKVGSILYVKLIGLPNSFIGTPEHTGVYIGNNNIVEVHGSGEIKCVTIQEFLGYDSLVRMGIYAYILTDENGMVLADPEIAARAKARIGEKIKYNLLDNNCHMFTSYCITGDIHNTDSTFLELTWAVKDHFKIKKVDWRVCIDQLEYSPINKSEHVDTYSESKGIIKYYLDYVPVTAIERKHNIFHDKVLGIRCTPNNTYLYIEYTSVAFLGGWYSFDLPVYLIDKTTNRKYKALEILPFQDKPSEKKAETKRIPKGDKFIGRLTFEAININREFSLQDRIDTIYSSIKWKPKA